MNFFLQTHIVKPGETLKQIAAMYHIPDVEILKYYHYQNVPKNANHLDTILLAGQEIFVPNRKEIEKILQIRNQRIEEKNFLANSLIENNTLLPHFVKINHHFIINIKDFSDDDLNNESHIEVHLKYLGKQEQHYVFSYHKKLISVNGEQPDLKIYELASKCTQCLFPVEFEIDEKGKIRNLSNYRQILNNWKKIRQKLQHEYQDSYSLDYIDDVNDSMDVREELIETFNRDIFLQFIFASYFKKFHQGNVEINERLTEHLILFQSQYSISVDDHKICINQHSQCTDSRSQQEIINHIKPSSNQHNENELLESEITASYNLEKNDKILRQAHVTFESYLYNMKDRREIKIEMK
ncbi:hypothetical protein ASG22_03170 [Chryseobacterium sp. Leaf405]|uniref:LysM peptidoglycan-binding domain-containing protein n=1 Tax=Chryseobacterium sp. Leaf405 TaxID=1736367 RepID=UPI0006F7FF5A|nr:LysM peptidoglycan-binding domain-containing protein [Chryseobacterium sp. Leaf405]KQT25725.1 hypothetical protein ASG22_03170 [Chryseobacterium sp. Leaf405]